MKDSIRETFLRAGFASRGNKEYEVSPCPTGTFVNASVSDPSKLKCLKCPAGKYRDLLNTCTPNPYFQMTVSIVAIIIYKWLSFCFERKPKIELDGLLTNTYILRTDNTQLFSVNCVHGCNKTGAAHAH